MQRARHVDPQEAVLARAREPDPETHSRVREPPEPVGFSRGPADVPEGGEPERDELEDLRAPRGLAPRDSPRNGGSLPRREAGRRARRFPRRAESGSRGRGSIRPWSRAVPRTSTVPSGGKPARPPKRWRSRFPRKGESRPGASRARSCPRAGACPCFRTRAPGPHPERCPTGGEKPSSARRLVARLKSSSRSIWSTSRRVIQSEPSRATPAERNRNLR